jgi:hypothetical protein
MQLRRLLFKAVLLVGIAARANAQGLQSGIAARDVNLYARLLAMTDTR